ncbi:MAG: SLAC1 anion channel family protein [Neomegalonema sp.]|nr:SLAC1 anion channel family protein [Neomegalonema sp.]
MNHASIAEAGAAPSQADLHPLEHTRLEEFPISFFAVTMGLGGLTLALRAAGHAAGFGALASHIVLALMIGVFCLLALVYAAKALRHPQAVAAEWQHPVRISFFPAVSISLLLMATALIELAPGIAQGVWLLGAGLQAVLTLSVIANWIGHRAFQPGHLNPAWFIPAVGNVVAPVAGAQLGFVELSWLFFSAGLMFWIVLLTLVMNRLVFHDPLPGRLTPTLVILIAPPAVAFIAWFRLTGTVDPFARILLNAAYVWAAVVLTQAPKIARLPFALPWWALSFPVAALAIASLLFAGATGSVVHRGIGLGLAALVLVIVSALALRTLMAIRARAICKPE